MSENRVFVRLLPLPDTVRGCVRPNDDGTFSVYLNARDDEKMRRETLSHELRHVELGHFYSEKSVAEMELEAEGAAPREARETVIYGGLEDLKSRFRP